MNNKLSKLALGIIKNIFYTPPLEGSICSTIIKDELEKDKPSMIARFGSVEIKAVLYPENPLLIKPLKKNTFKQMYAGGFFPCNEKTISHFSELMIEDMKLLDVLGSWRIEECLLQKHFPLAKRIKLSELEPYLQQDPWSEVLENKKILVIHPFDTAIEDQYNNRQLLFKDSRVLPKFKSLETIKAVMILKENDSPFEDWFAALNYMKTEIDKKDFDIAIIGCGPFGFPLAAHVKRIGKKAVHLGGATQILFGIKGKRWIEDENFKDIINENFIFPSDVDKPKGFLKMDGGCYW